MKWMKHVTTANKDDKLISIRAEFGMWGIGVYWTLVELTAEKISEKTETAEAMLIVSELLGLFGCKRNKLETFLKHSANVLLFKYELNGNILKIDIPKLLDYADNYIKYDGKSLKCLQRQSKLSLKQDKDIDKEEEKKKIKIYAEDSQELILSKNLYLQMLRNDPKAKEPNFQLWAKEIDALHRIDQRNFEDIMKVILFCQSHSFWKTNILSTKKLRYQFPKLFLQMEEVKNGVNTKTSQTNSTIARATFRHGEAEIQRLRELKATLDERDRVRRIRTQSDSEQGS